jgi:hypothetical protein
MSEATSYWRNLYKVGGWMAIILLQNKMAGLLRLDALTTMVMPLYYLFLLMILNGLFLIPWLPLVSRELFHFSERTYKSKEHLHVQ